MSSPKGSDSRDDDVILSAVDAREIARLLRLLGTIQDSEPDEIALKKRAEAVISERNRRAKFFGRSMLGEPAWDILLQLYVADRQRLPLRDIVLMTEEPKTTARRWIDYLEHKKLVQRRPDPVDRRSTEIELHEHGRELLDAYFRDAPRLAAVE